jgi:hypothetical protein
MPRSSNLPGSIVATSALNSAVEPFQHGERPSSAWPRRSGTVSTLKRLRLVAATAAEEAKTVQIQPRPEMGTKTSGPGPAFTICNCSRD